MHVRSRAPLRIGLAGGGTDLDEYSNKYGGAVLNIAINRYAFADLSDTNSGYFEAIATDIGQQLCVMPGERVVLNDCSLPLHLAVYLYFIENFNGGQALSVLIKTYCDAPPGSGLGSSSTLVVCMVKAWNEYFNSGLDEYAIAETAYVIERQICGFAGGKQDQYSASFGGINFIEFQPSGVVVHPLRVKNWFQCELESSLLLHHVGTSRESARIIDDQKKLILSDLGKLQQMHSMKTCAYAMKNALLRNCKTNIKACLNEGWRAKQLTSSLVNNAVIAERIELATFYGAEACKISGAGGGGYILLYVDPARAVVLRDNLVRIYRTDTFFVSISGQASESWILKDA